MRYIKPLKGFRFWRTLGMLFFSTAVLTSQTSADKALALELPLLPMTMAAAPALAPAPLASADEQQSLNAPSSEVSEAAVEEKMLPVTIEQTSEEVVSDETTSKPALNVSAPENSEKDVTPLATDVNLKTDENVSAIEKTETEVITSIQEQEALPVATSTLKAEISTVANEMATDSAVVAEPVISLSENSEKVEKPLDNPASPQLLKTNEKSVAEISLPSNTSNAEKVTSSKKVESKKTAKKTAKKSAKKSVKPVVVDESVPPEGWDWFSTPLVWAEDANGKMILVADKNAPKIEIGGNKESKAVDFANDLPLITSVKPAEPDYIQVEPIAADTVAMETSEPQTEVICDEVVQPVSSEKLSDAPSASADFEEAPAIAYDRMSDEQESVVDISEAPVSDNASDCESKVSMAKNVTYKPFFRALAKIKRARALRRAKSEAEGEAAARANWSAQAIKVNNYIKVLLNKSDLIDDPAKEVNQGEKHLLVSSSDDECASKSISEAPLNSNYVEVTAERVDSENTENFEDVENTENMKFKPYIRGGSASRVKRIKKVIRKIFQR